MYKPIVSLHFLVSKLEFSDGSLNLVHAKQFNLQLINHQRLTDNLTVFGATGS